MSNPIVTIETNLGTIEAELYEDAAPKTVANFIDLATHGYYDDVIFHRVIDNFMIQPYIFSKSVKSHPLEVFVVIITSGVLFGIVGLIIAIPLYTSVKVIYLSYSGKET